MARVPIDFSFALVDGCVHCSPPGRVVQLAAVRAAITHVRVVTVDRATIAAAARLDGCDPCCIVLPSLPHDSEYLSSAFAALWSLAIETADARALEAELARFLHVVFTGACYASQLVPHGTRGLRTARASILDACESDLTLASLTATADMTKSHFVRGFHRAYGLPPHAYLMQVRIEHARRLLALGQRPIEVATSLRFADQSHLHRRFTMSFGLSPSAYKERIAPVEQLPADWCRLGGAVLISDAH